MLAIARCVLHVAGMWLACGWHVAGMCWHAPGMWLAYALLASLGVGGTWNLI